MAKLTFRLVCLTGASWVCVLLALGCDAAVGPLAQVHGKVSYKGTPLRAGCIVFCPDAQRGTQGPLSHAEVQPDGTYVLRTGNALGAVPGWHRVTVMAIEAPTPAAPGQKFVTPRSLLPDKYRDPELSGLTCQVLADTENKIDMNLD